MDTPLTAPCIFCGDDRPLEAETCPKCGRGWIDSRLPEPQPAPAAVEPDVTPEPAPEAATEPAPRPDVAPEPEPASAAATEPEPEAEPALQLTAMAAPEQLGFTTEDPGDTAPGDAEVRLPVHTDSADTGWNDADAESAGESEELLDSAEAAASVERSVPATAPGIPTAAGIPDAPEEREEAQFGGDTAEGIADATGEESGAAVAGEAGDDIADDIADEWNPLVPWDAKDWGEDAGETAEGAAAGDGKADDDGGFADLVDLPEPDASMLAPLPSAPEPAPPAEPPSDPAPFPPADEHPATGPAPEALPAAAGPPPIVEPVSAGSHDNPAGARPRSRRVQSLAVIGAVAAVVIGWFVILSLITRGDGDDVVTQPPAVATTTTAAATTSPPDDSAATTATGAPETTAPQAVPQLPAEGEPLEISDLALGGFALGPFDFGTTGALGRLVATFGQADAVTSTSEEWGTCPGDQGLVVTWGPLDVIFLGTIDEATLVGFRLHAGGDHPAADLMTLSGFSAGGTVAELQQTYADFDVALEDVGGVDSFILSRITDGVTLLWGPVSSTEPAGVVEGVFSPRPCDQGPTPVS